MAHVKYSYTEYEFKAAVASSTTVRQVLSKLGVIPAGGNYTTFRRRVAEWNVDVSHFHRSTDVARRYNKYRDTSEYLQRGTLVTSNFLRKRLIRDGYLAEVCSRCRGVEWLGIKIPLELDHIDGDHTNNELDNLRLLCPNCHALTDTYRGKNVKNRMERRVSIQKYANVHTSYKMVNRKRYKRCDECHARVAWTRAMCSSCKAKDTRRSSTCVDCESPCCGTAERCLPCSKARLKTAANIPPQVQLIEKLEELQWNYSATGRHFGVSDNAVRKWCKKYGITKPQK